MDLTTQNTNGASNASDFQPPTGNPQQAGNTNQSSNQSLQPGVTRPGSQDLLNTSTPLTVETDQSSTGTSTAPVVTPQLESSGFGGWVIFVLLVAAIVAAVLAYRRWNIFTAHTEPFLPPVDLETEKPKTETKKPKKKPAAVKNRPKKRTKRK